MAQESRIYKRAVVPIAELVEEDGLLDGFTFDDCYIRGPAILVLQGKGELSNCTFRGDAETILWEVPPTRKRISGVIVAKDCTFTRCVFSNIGFAGPPEFIQMMESQVSVFS